MATGRCGPPAERPRSGPSSIPPASPVPTPSALSSKPPAPEPTLRAGVGNYPEAVWFGSGGQGLHLGLGIIALFCFGGRNVADGFEQPTRVVPVDPFEGGELQRLEAPPGTAPVDHLGLEQADHRLGQRIIVGVPDAADGGLDAGLGEALGIANAQVLRSSVRMTHEPAAGKGLALMKSLLQGIED